MGVYTTILVSFPSPFVVPLWVDNFDLFSLPRKMKPASYLPTCLPKKRPKREKTMGDHNHFQEYRNLKET